MARSVPQYQTTDHHPTPSLRVIHGHGGGTPPQAWTPPVSNAQLAILIVIAFEAMIFMGLITAYFVFRNSLVGLHALHVIAAVVWVLSVLLLARRWRFTPTRHAGVQLCAMYWYFV